MTKISIHALRVEGDVQIELYTKDKNPISIHALRVEGDTTRMWSTGSWICDFYPRPPGGGRPSAPFSYFTVHPISIHALRVEGD